MRILLIEDYSPLRESIAESLTTAGYTVDSSATGDEGLWYAENTDYDATILDIMLPNVDGLTILRKLKKLGNKTPVLLISARDSLEQKIEGLDAGACDYLVKPFELKELHARVRAHLRKRYNQDGDSTSVGDLTLNFTSRRVTRGGEEIALTRREYGLLEYFAYRVGDVVTRQEIWDHVYEDVEGGTSNAVDVYVSYLRKKLNAGDRDNLLHTRRGQGYYLEASETE
jgi:DNA-binding response OmpR family regulator